MILSLLARFWARLFPGYAAPADFSRPRTAFGVEVLWCRAGSEVGAAARLLLTARHFSRPLVRQFDGAPDSVRYGALLNPHFPPQLISALFSAERWGADVLRDVERSQNAGGLVPTRALVEYLEALLWTKSYVTDALAIYLSLPPRVVRPETLLGIARSKWIWIYTKTALADLAGHPKADRNTWAALLTSPDATPDGLVTVLTHAPSITRDGALRSLAERWSSHGAIRALLVSTAPAQTLGAEWRWLRDHDRAAAVAMLETMTDAGLRALALTRDEAVDLLQGPDARGRTAALQVLSGVVAA